MGSNGGRNTKLTPEMQERICSSIRAGNYKETAAVTSGIGETTLYEWLKKGREAKTGAFRDFWESVKEAEHQAEAKALAVVQKAANGFEVKKHKTVVDHEGNATITEEVTHESHWQAAAWYLERTRGDRYKRKESHELTGPDGGPIRVTMMDLAKIAEDEDE